MIPAPWVGLVLAFGAYRLTRLLGWDDWPPIARSRAWLLGEKWTMARGVGGAPDTYVAVYKRPLLQKLVHCPFCIGWWVCLATYLAWLLWPSGTLYGAFPFALSGAVGLLAKNLDP